MQLLLRGRAGRSEDRDRRATRTQARRLCRLKCAHSSPPALFLFMPKPVGRLFPCRPRFAFGHNDSEKKALDPKARVECCRSMGSGVDYPANKNKKVEIQINLLPTDSHPCDSITWAKGDCYEEVDCECIACRNPVGVGNEQAGCLRR